MIHVIESKNMRSKPTLGELCVCHAVWPDILTNNIFAKNLSEIQKLHAMYYDSGHNNTMLYSNRVGTISQTWISQCYVTIVHICHEINCTLKNQNIHFYEVKIKNFTKNTHLNKSSMVFYYVNTFKKVWKKQKKIQEKTEKSESAQRSRFFNLFVNFRFFHTFLKV